MEEKRRDFIERKAAEEQKREELLREKEKKMWEKRKAEEKQNEIPIPEALAELKPVTQLTKEEIQEERKRKEKRFKANQKKVRPCESFNFLFVEAIYQRQKMINKKK